jgi:hypothetical protein
MTLAMLDDDEYHKIYKDIHERCFGDVNDKMKIIEEQIFSRKIEILSEMLRTSQFSSDETHFEEIFKNTLIGMQKLILHV